MIEIVYTTTSYYHSQENRKQIIGTTEIGRNLTVFLTTNRKCLLRPFLTKYIMEYIIFVIVIYSLYVVVHQLIRAINPSIFGLF